MELAESIFSEQTKRCRRGEKQPRARLENLVSQAIGVFEDREVILRKVQYFEPRSE